MYSCSQPASSVQRVLQARILEWVAISFSRGSTQPRDQIRVSFKSHAFQADSLPLSHLGKPGRILSQTKYDTHTARELPVLFSPGFRTLRSRPCSSLPLLPCLQVDCQSQKLLGAEDRKRRRFSFSRCSPLAGSVLSLLPLVMSKDSSVSNL